MFNKRYFIVYVNKLTPFCKYSFKQYNLSHVTTRNPKKSFKNIKITIYMRIEIGKYLSIYIPSKWKLSFVSPIFKKTVTIFKLLIIDPILIFQFSIKYFPNLLTKKCLHFAVIIFF